MKCQNCKCQISNDFTYSFSVNCCPKCGKSMMTAEVRNLYNKMINFLAKDNNDIGDLAFWFSNEHIPSLIKNSNPPLATTTVEENNSLPSSNEEPSSQSSSIAKIKPKPIKTHSSDTMSIFAKRAGVDKIKFETIIKDIQGSITKDEIDTDISDETADEDIIGDSFNGPLSDREINEMTNLFSAPESQKIDFNEIKRLQKLEQLQDTGTIGKIKRSE